MNTMKALLLVVLLSMGIFVVGCSIKTTHSKGPEVNAQCQMSEDEKEAFAELVARKVVELETRR
ncbi:MAG: hypothetical protein ACYTEL_08355 [Planctomycetota bacterium]